MPPGAEIPQQTHQIRQAPLPRPQPIEIMFRRLKDWRHGATRYDCCPTVFFPAVALAVTVIFWLRSMRLELNDDGFAAAPLRCWHFRWTVHPSPRSRVHQKVNKLLIQGTSGEVSMKIVRSVLLPIAFCASFIAGAADATPLLFNFTGQAFSGPLTASFTLDSNPLPDRINDQSAFGFGQIFFNDVDGTFNGTTQTASSISFGTAGASQFQISGTSLGFAQFGGQNVFSGTFSNPVFSPGIYQFGGFTSGTLTISQLVTAAPEPATWAMMIMGFGIVGVAMRRRRKVAMHDVYAA